MFENLGANLGKIFDKLTKKGFLSEDDCNLALREVRIALLEADVSLSIVKDFIEKIKVDLIGKEIIKKISPGQMVIKLVQDHLTTLLGSEKSELNLSVSPPAVIMMVGLQGSGKTTSSAKLALRIKQKQHKKILLAALDVARPAALEQLAVLAKQAEITSLAIVAGDSPIDITKRAMALAKLESYDIVILDTAGRLHIDDLLMDELVQIKSIANPVETLFVADSMTGQDSVNIASVFHQKIGITGVILTRIDGDSRGGAALSIKGVTGCAIKFIGVGEKLSEFEEFHPERIASRILDMGDIVSLVEKAAESIDMEEAEAMAKKMQKGSFDLNDMASQIKTIRKMGGLGGMMAMIPGVKKLQSQLAGGGIDEKIIGRQEAIISSMTKQERRFPKILNASRKRRIASGAGVSAHEINKLLKQYQDMATMVKKLGKMDQKSFLRSGMAKLFS
jgi:signal recognition particle subunit SRP54